MIDILMILTMLLFGIITVAYFFIETLRFRWLDFEELPFAEQKRLLIEAEQTVYTIGGFHGSPDPRAMRYYTKLPRRRT
jgi:hypothetical protein